MASFIVQPLYARYPLGMRLGGPQKQAGRGGEGKKILTLPECNPGVPARSLVVTVTELFMVSVSNYVI